MSPAVVPAPMGARVSASSEIVHLCPFKDEADTGRVTVEWETRGGTFELHSLAEYFGTFEDKKLSHEQLATQIMNDLAAPTVAGVRVEVRFVTAGMVVEVVRALPSEPVRR